MKKIRRQIIALFLCMAMVITVLPVHIKADAVTAVTSIPFALEGFTCGNDISNVKLTTTEPGIEIVSATFYIYHGSNNGSAPKAKGNIQQGIQYTLEIFAKVKSGYSIDGIGREEITIDGKKPSYYKAPSSDGASMRIYHYLPRFEGEPASYKIQTTNASVKDAKGLKVTSSITGRKYQLCVDDIPEGKQFAGWEVEGENTSVGNVMNPATSIVMGTEDVKITAKLEDTSSDKTTFTNVSVPLKAPETEKTPSTYVASNESYVVGDVKWYREMKGTDGKTIHVEQPCDVKFWEGMAYRAEITVYGKSSFFSKTTTYKIANQNAVRVAPEVIADKIQKVTIACTFPATRLKNELQLPASCKNAPEMIRGNILFGEEVSVIGFIENLADNDEEWMTKYIDGEIYIQWYESKNNKTFTALQETEYAGDTITLDKKLAGKYLAAKVWYETSAGEEAYFASIKIPELRKIKLTGDYAIKVNAGESFPKTDNLQVNYGVIKSVKWYDKATGKQMNDSQMFESGQFYVMNVEVDTQEENLFEDTADLESTNNSLIKETWAKSAEVTYDQNTKLHTIHRVYKASKLEEVQLIALGVEEPARGHEKGLVEYKEFAGSFVGKNETTIEAVEWSPTDTVFAPATSYTLTVTLKSKDGFCFTKDTKITLNQKEMKIISPSPLEKEVKEVKAAYTFDKTAEELKPEDKETIVLDKMIQGQFKNASKLSVNQTTLTNWAAKDVSFQKAYDTGKIVYQWMKSTDGKNYTAIPEATKDTYFIPKEFEDKTYIGLQITVGQYGDTDVYKLMDNALIRYEEILSVNGVKEPEVGEYPSIEGITPTGAKLANWYDITDDEPLMGPFEKGKEYQLILAWTSDGKSYASRILCNGNRSGMFMEDPSVGLMGCNIMFSHAHEKQTTYGSDDTSHWFTCYESGCDKQYETEEHTFGTWIIDKEATKTASGSKHRECSVCHRKVLERIPKIGEIVPTPTPGGSTPAPGGSTPAPGGSTPIPGGSTPAPGGSTPAPGGSTPIPGGSTPIPGGSTPIPGGSIGGNAATNPGAKENQSIITGNQIDFNGEFAKTDVKTKLQKPTKIKIQKKKGKLLLSWKKIAKASGYEIQIAANKRFKKAVKKKTKKPVLQMKKWKKKICFLRVRAYQQKSGKTVYSGWSKVVKKKMK